jgi:hypothetical protein
MERHQLSRADGGAARICGGLGLMPFTQKLLSFTFDLANGDHVAVSGLRASVTVTMGGQVDMGGMACSIYGLTPSLTNQLSTLGQLIPEVRRNFVTVSAGDKSTGLSTVYQGVIFTGVADYASMPNNAFRIGSPTGGYQSVQPIPPTTIKGAADVATIMSGLAQQANLHFENNGVQQQFFDPYFPGAVKEQIQRVADKANINCTIDPSTNTLVIWPRGTPRGSLIPLISPDTGMIDYPTWDASGTAEVATVYNASIRYGTRVQIQSSLPAANKQWDVINLTHELESMVPGGAWRTRLRMVAPGVLQVR